MPQYVARDISFTPLGKLGVVQLLDNLSQALERFYKVRMTEYIGTTVQNVRSNLLSKVEVSRWTEDFINDQQSSFNYELYVEEERVRRIDVESVEITNDRAVVDLQVHLGTQTFGLRVII